MTRAAEKLYELLPDVYRQRDGRNDYAIKALLGVVGEQVAILQESNSQLYDDQFIETCAEWVVPYIGDLIGCNALHGNVPGVSSPRAEVANTIAYRRRKGTATVLEQLARDVTGWDARAVEFFQQLATTQYMNHVRPGNHYAPDLGALEILERLGGAFNTVAHTIDVRHPDLQAGKFNIPNVGIWLWRLGAYAVDRSPATRLDDRRLFFSPLAANAQLVTRPQAETDISTLATPLNVPEPISRNVLNDPVWFERLYGRELSLFLWIDGDPVAASEVRVCNLVDHAGDWGHPPSSGVAIDPELGRIYLPVSLAGADVEVRFHYGFSANIGGGDYERADSFNGIDAPDELVSGNSGLQTAVDSVQGGGTVEFEDFGRHSGGLSINVDADAALEIRSKNQMRATIDVSAAIEIRGGEDSTVVLNGLLIVGGPLVVPADNNSLDRLVLRHCTLVPGISLDNDGAPAQPGAPSLIVEADHVRVEIDGSILGAVRAPAEGEVKIRNSIVDANDKAVKAVSNKSGVAFAAPDGTSPGASLELRNCTVIGLLHTRALSLATNVIFAAELAAADTWSSPVVSEIKQKGCVRFSYVPVGSRVPRRYRCQPELAVSRATEAASAGGVALTAAEKLAIAELQHGRVRPTFTSQNFGSAAYAQLSEACAPEIGKGADDESEMGAFHDLYQPQREANIRLRLREYLRFGLTAGIFYSN
jgi:hypothetical protein